MHGAASGLIEAFQTVFSGLSTDWDCIPVPPNGWYKYGSGGIGCWGTLCGVPNGAIAVLNMLNLHGACQKSVLDFYSTTSFPTADLCGATAPWPGSAQAVTAPTPMDDATEVLAHTISDSPICHVSISKWCYAAGVSLASKDSSSRGYKNDRCGKICAEIAAHTARLINGQAPNELAAPGTFAGSPYYALAPGYTIPTSTAQCMGCHTKASDLSLGHAAQCGEMQCDECHTDFAPHKGKQFLFERLWTEGWDSVNSKWVPQITFAANDWIRYCMQFSVFAPGKLFVRMKPQTSGAEGYDSGGPPWKQGYFNNSADCSNTTNWYFPGTGGVRLPATAITKGRFKAQVQVGDSAAGPMIFESPLKMVYFDVNP
jgi:hypothetical protein